MARRYNPPPNWPQPPSGWTPPAGWQPDPAWGPPPSGWQLWVDDRNWFSRHKVLTGLGAFIVLIVAISAASAGGSGSDNTVTTGTTGTAGGGSEQSSPPAAAEGSSDKGPGLGDNARDGKFQFTVTSLDCGQTKVGDAYLNKKAQGQFCMLHLKVKNIGGEARTFDGSNQELYDTRDRKYDADTEAAVYLDDSQSFLNEVNPGNVVRGIVVFDVPKSFTPKKVELHDSPFSGGVDVDLQ
jgi:hypothetical protein